MRGRHLPYSATQLTFIKRNCTLPRKEHFQLFCKKFNREDVSLDNFKALCKRNGWLTGRNGRFKKGSSGHKGSPGGPNKTSFKKGNVPANIKPLYAERTTKDGYIEIKVPEINPYTSAPTRYRHKHQWVWEQRHGTVPQGHILHFIDGDRTNCNLDNLEVIPRGVGAIMNKNKYSSLPDEIKPAVKILAKLQYRQHKLEQTKGG